MRTGTIYERVRDITIEKMRVENPESISEETSFVGDLGADSLDLVELIMGMEEEFSTDEHKIQVSDEDAKDIKTVGDAVKYLKDHGVEEQ